VGKENTTGSAKNLDLSSTDANFLDPKAGEHLVQVNAPGRQATHAALNLPAHCTRGIANIHGGEGKANLVLFQNETTPDGHQGVNPKKKNPCRTSATEDYLPRLFVETQGSFSKPLGIHKFLKLRQRGSDIGKDSRICREHKSSYPQGTVIQPKILKVDGAIHGDSTHFKRIEQDLPLLKKEFKLGPGPDETRSSQSQTDILYPIPEVMLQGPLYLRPDKLSTILVQRDLTRYNARVRLGKDLTGVASAPKKTQQEERQGKN
jgi:hypothetical protein